MRRALLMTAATLLPTAAFATPLDVPAIQMAQNTTAPPAIVATSPQPAAAAGGPQPTQGPQGPVIVPPGQPPQVHPISQDAPLLPKEVTATIQAQAWRNKNEKPVTGADGVVRWVFGHSAPSVVCAINQVCDIELQPNEIVNNINVGDKSRWNPQGAISGEGTTQTQHVVVRPSDAGLVSSMIIYTEQRTYFIKLISTQSKFTPLTGFIYDDSAAGGEWLGQGGSMPTHASIGGGASGNIDFNYHFSGDNPPWKPVRAYSVGGKVYIDFPKDMQFATSPVLIGLNDDGGLFRSESEKMLIYRFAGNRMVVDGLFEHAKLVVGVGGRSTEVDIRHKP